MAESSLEKARTAAQWFHEKVPITAFPSYRTDYVIALLAAYAASAVALEREQCAQIAEAMSQLSAGASIKIARAIRARRGRKAGENG